MKEYTQIGAIEVEKRDALMRLLARADDLLALLDNRTEPEKAVRKRPAKAAK